MGIFDRVRWSYGSFSRTRITLTVVAYSLISISSFVVIGLYGRDVDLARKAGVGVDGRWGYALALAVISIILCFVHTLPRTLRRPHVLFPIDLVMWLLWLILFGIFGKLYINAHCEGDDKSKCERMKVAVWFDLANVIFWLGSGILGAVNWRRERIGGPAMSQV